MEFVVVTLFPHLLPGPLGEGVLGKALSRGVLRLQTCNPRDWAIDRHGTVDDAPYGGGGGMVLRPEPLFAAVEAVRAQAPGARTRTVLLGPAGAPLNQQDARRLVEYERLILVCGRYEGVDERVRQSLVDEEISIGDYVLSGGELPAMIVIEAVGRLVPGVLGRSDSAERESFEDGLLDHPHFTRPASFRGMEVPEVLRGGDHAAIEGWRRQAAIDRTRARRPDLMRRREGSRKGTRPESAETRSR
jgi:tRNA (guanine37-N1)-methyltransferase